MAHEAAWAAVRARVDALVAQRSWLQIGNIGEQVTGGVLTRLGYQVLAFQDDLLQGLPGPKPEDALCITPDGRLATVNSKASVSARRHGITRAGSLRAPRVPRDQRVIPYSTLRAGLFTDLEGDTYSQIVKVDLSLLLAQVFIVDDRLRLRPSSEVLHVGDLVAELFGRFPGRVPPPRVDDLS